MTSCVLGVAGPIGSGKSTVARALAASFGCPIASFGSYVRGVAERTGGDASRVGLQKLAEELISSIGLDGLTRAVLAAAKWDRKASLIVDGIRHSAVVAALRSQVAPVVVVITYLDVSPQIRLQRFAARDNLGQRDLAAFDAHATEREADQIRKAADIIVNADGSLDETVKAVLRQIQRVIPRSRLTPNSDPLAR